MDSIATILMIVGILALPIAVITFIISLVKKKSKAKPLIIFLVGVLCFFIGVFIMPSSPATEEEQPSATQPNPIVEKINNGVLQYPASNENFKYNIYDTYIEITEYIGSQSASSITVPSTLENLPVYVVDAYVFNKCEVPTIIFEEGIYDIRSGFSPSLENITLPSTLNRIGSYQFKNCYSLKNIVIPEGIDSILLGAFQSCTALKEITIPSTITSIDTGLFENCFELETVNLPNGLTIIGEKAFIGCENLKTITIPDTVTEIDFNAFQGSGLVSVEIPASVTTMGANVFLGCESLKEVKCHNSDVEIKPFTYYKDGIAYATTTDLFSQCNEDLVVYGKPASAIAKTCANENVYFKPF